MPQTTVAITGSHGFIGKALYRHLNESGYRVVRVVRGKTPESGEIGWDPERDRIDAAGLEGLDAVVHLAGEPIADGRWNRALMQRIRDSRVEGTALLSQTLAALDSPPHTLVSASAVGYYGDTGNKTVEEDAPPGDSFLSDVCREWEGATRAAEDSGIRVARLRIGTVLDPGGGALAAMLPAFRFGLGGPVGSGRQWISWIALEDLCRIFRYVIETPQLTGALNAVAPRPVTNAEFTQTLGEALRRPAFLPLPAIVARVLFGRVVDETLLCSNRVLPSRLINSGFRFECSQIEQTLVRMLRKSN